MTRHRIRDWWPIRAERMKKTKTVLTVSSQRIAVFVQNTNGPVDLRRQSAFPLFHSTEAPHVRNTSTFILVLGQPPLGIHLAPQRTPILEPTGKNQLGLIGIAIRRRDIVITFSLMVNFYTLEEGKTLYATAYPSSTRSSTQSARIPIPPPSKRPPPRLVPLTVF